MSVFDANPNSQYRPVNTNAGIVTPNINNVVSEKNMNTFALGPNGETGIPTTLVKTQQEANKPDGGVTTLNNGYVVPASYNGYVAPASYNGYVNPNQVA